jgi:hypothetical protein
MNIQRMQYLAIIVVLLHEGQDRFNISRTAVGLGNCKGITDGRIVEEARRGNHQF